MVIAGCFATAGLSGGPERGEHAASINTAVTQVEQGPREAVTLCIDYSLWLELSRAAQRHKMRSCME
jgi:hypothetical protein